MTAENTYRPTTAYWDHYFVTSDGMLYHRMKDGGFVSTPTVVSTVGKVVSDTEEWGYVPLRSMARKSLGPWSPGYDPSDPYESDPTSIFRPGYDPTDPYFTPVGDGIGVMIVLAMAYLLFRKVRLVRTNRTIQIN